MSIVNALEMSNEDVFRLRMSAVGPSRLLIKLKCGADGADHHFTKRLADSLLGSIICVAQFVDNNRHISSTRRPSNAFLVICRCLTYDNADVDDVGLRGNLDNVFMRVCANRRDLELWGPPRGDTMRIIPVTSCIAHQSLFKAFHMSIYMHPVLRACFFWK